MATLKERFVNALFGTPIQPKEVTPSVSYGQDVDNYLNTLGTQPYMQGLLNQPKEVGLSLEKYKEGVANGLNYGIPEIAKRQDELGIRKPQTEEEIYQARLGDFNQPTTLNAGTSNAPRQGGFLNDLASGFKENYTQGFNVDNLQPQNKGFATKLGEGVGTLARFYDKPVGRGLLAGAIGLALGGGAGGALAAGLATGVGRQQYKTADQIYRNQLKQMGMTDEELNNIKGNVTKEMFEGITSGMRYNNQRVTYGQLAPFSPEIQEAIDKNPILEYQYLPVNLARDFYSKKGEQAEGKMAKVAAETKKIEKETKHIGEPKVNINIRKGGTNSTITHVGGGNNPTQPTDAGIVRVQAPNGQTGTIPRARLREAIKAGYKVI